MRLKSARLSVAHCEPGHHLEFNRWHDYDHRPEIMSNTPLCYWALRWVAPPDYVAVRPPTELPYGGGEYFYIYLSEGTQEQWAADVAAVSRKLNFNGREEPLRYLKSAFGGGVHLTGAATRPGLELSADAVPLAPGNTALVVNITEVTDVDRREEYARWHDAVLVPAVLREDICSAYYHFMPVVQAEVDDRTRQNERTLRGFGPDAPRRFHIFLYFMDFPEPLAAFERYKRTVQQHAPLNDAWKPVFTGIYRPIVPGQYDFYT